MNILIADDDTISRLTLDRTLRGWGHTITAVSDGQQAWEILQGANRPELAILDWMMPGMEGPELCRRCRELALPVPTYLILLTSRDTPGDIVAGLQSGAYDYVTKPFDRAELQSRVSVGERFVRLQQGLADRVCELETTLARIKRLHGLLPICAWCKHIRSDGDYWQSVEGYIAEHADVNFTHGICPTCLAREAGEDSGDVARRLIR